MNHNVMPHYILKRVLTRRAQIAKLEYDIFKCDDYRMKESLNKQMQTLKEDLKILQGILLGERRVHC